MVLAKVSPQMFKQLELPVERQGEAPKANRSVETDAADDEDERSGTSDLLEKALSRSNLQAALKRVKDNKGSPGVDGMTVEDLPAYLREKWLELREQLFAGSFQPSQVKQQMIPKSGGGMRQLGIPTVLDRFIQQALLQVLQPIFDPGFSEHSHGFRPGRRAHDAVIEAQGFINQGRRWVVDVDLEKFFDLVNHDVLMGKLAKRIVDTRILGLVRRFLQAGILANGVTMERHMGTPQGGPLSPLLANVLLDHVDKELEKRGHSFVRYADDCNVYVRSKRAGERVMQMLRRLYAELKLKINEDKSAIDLAWNRKLLGFSFWNAPGRVVKRRIAAKAIATMKDRIRQITRRNGGRSIKQVVRDLQVYLPGWKQYFGLAETPKTFRTLDEWIRRRLRALHLKHWKRGTTAYRELRALGATERIASKVASNTRRWWRNSKLDIHLVLTNKYFAKLGVPRLAA